MEIEVYILFAIIRSYIHDSALLYSEIAHSHSKLKLCEESVGVFFWLIDFAGDIVLCIARILVESEFRRWFSDVNSYMNTYLTGILSIRNDCYKTGYTCSQYDMVLLFRFVKNIFVNTMALYI